MKHELSPQQIEQFQTQGYVIIEDFLDAAELEVWRDAVDAAVANRATMKLPDRQWVGHGDDEKYYEKVFTQRLQLWKDSEAVRELMFDERLGKMVAELAGVDGVRIWHDQALYKPAWGEPTGWHLDAPFWSFSSKAATSLWVALDDAHQANGCMYYMPGTHLETNYDNPGITEEIASVFNVYPQFKDRETIPVILPAGGAAFHNASMLHAAGPNMTPHVRRAMTCAYMPDGATYNGKQNILSDTEAAALKTGDLLNDDSKNPLIYSKTSVKA